MTEMNQRLNKLLLRRMQETASCLSAAYDELLVNAARTFASKMRDQKDYDQKEYCLFHPSFGNVKKEPVDFLIYGQALNGSWNPTFLPGDEIGPALADAAREYSNTMDEGQKNPLDWVNLLWGKMSKSFFWQVSYKLVCDYHHGNREDTSWSEKLVWSNLMKISPVKGGNPDNKEYEAHIKDAISLFRAELNELQPRFAVFLTNWDWAEPFIRSIQSKKKLVAKKDSLIHWSGDYGRTKLIVTHRPYPTGRSDDYVKAILAIIGKQKPQR